MNGHSKYIAAAVAAAIGIAPGPASAGLSEWTEAFGVAPAPQVADTHPPHSVPAARSDADLAITDAVSASLDGPHVLDGAVADLIVRLHGGVCTGTPITGTVYVVTAAHCVLTATGEITQRTIVREHVRYPAVAVLVDTDYFDRPSAELDAAVLIMAQVIPGPSVRLGSAVPASGQVTLAGFQPVDTDGSLLRGDGPHDHPLPKDATATRVEVGYGPAGCDVPASALDVSPARVMVPCGLVPGASGGGLYAEENGELVLVGILSTVTADLTANGVVPLASLQELLEHPDRYAHGFSTAELHHEHVRSELS